MPVYHGATIGKGVVIDTPIADGSPGQVMETDGAGALSFTTIAGGTPGGSDTQVQYNNGGAFGGMAGVAWNDTANELTMTAQAADDTPLNVVGATGSTEHLVDIVANTADAGAGRVQLAVTNTGAGSCRILIGTSGDSAEPLSGMQLYASATICGWADYEARPLVFYTTAVAGTSVTERFRIGPEGSLYLTELAAAASDIAGKGQLWVKNTTPNELWFTDDAGNDRRLAKRQITLYVTDFATAIATGDGATYWRVPSDLDGFNIVDVAAQLGAAQSSSGTPTVQIARLRFATAGGARTAVDVLSTKITIDANEWDSKDATTPAVINAANDDMSEGDLLRIDIDAAGTGAQGLFVTIGFA